MSVNLTPEEIDELKEENRNLRSEVKRLFSESRKLLRERDYGRMMSERSKLTFQAKDKLSQLVFTEKSRLEKYMNMLLDNTPDIVMFFDENGRIVFVSSAYLRRSNIAAIGLIYGKSLDDMLKPVVSEEFLSHVDEMFRRAMEEKLTTEAEQEIDFGLDGRLRSYQIQMTPMLEDGEVKGSIVTFYDMTEVKQAQRDAEHARELAEQSTRAKSDFLSRMSHEIRTPMNAISGMSELLLRRDLDEDSKGYARDIKQASANLMSLINDLLDISKIEAGRLEIIPVTYYPSSLINDVVNIIRMRLAEKPIRFYTNIDAAIPGMMIGDEVRLRQILLNMLNNAAKYTEKGFVSLTITRDDAEGDMVTLRIVVADSGVGIKPEDQQKLFGEFIQVDTKRNRGIEGTGLGLAITKRLCAAMGGDISVESEYGRGSVFTACIPQRTASEAPFASVENLGGKKTLVYERRMVYAKSIAWSLENMGVPHRLTSDIESFARALREEEWYFVFSGYGLYDRIMPVMELAERECPEKKRPHLALMVEWGSEKYIPNARFVSLPLQTLSISDVLNGAPVRRDCMESALFTGTRFTAPGTRLLVVDDIATNLKVAEGLIAPYKADVDACLSGAEAVELVKRNRYDIVFMDHMMPDMDGVEAALLIREWEKGHGCADGRPPVPIIALTANAVSGMREMFIEAGFNDFLAKPIDVSKLDEIIEKWLPREKQ
ncbi:MAG: response regulator, partial [Synergistaceae bacterium]|nr:response regulator [Synergistaceae bacterium]